MVCHIAPVTNNSDVHDSQKLLLACVSTLGLVPRAYHPHIGFVAGVRVRGSKGEAHRDHYDDLY
eukprot:70847-Prorocentrum_minimum.AAC.2